MQTLTTARLDLVPLDPERDAGSLHAMLGDPELDEFGHEPPTRHVAETRSRLERDLAENGGWTWVVRLRPDESALGTIGIFSDHGRPIRGLSWSMRRDHWGRGLMGEAAPVVVDHLLAQPGITGVEAWIDSRNTRSLGVARRARLSERARLTRVYADHTAQSVVMVRATEPRDPDVLGVRPVLPVRDVRVTAQLLVDVLGLHVAFEHGEPPTLVRLGVDPWSGSPGPDVVSAGGVSGGEDGPVRVAVDIGIPTDTVYERARAAGVEIVEPPQDQPWYRREFTFRLPEGHAVRVLGPLRPTGA